MTDQAPDDQAPDDDATMAALAEQLGIPHLGQAERTAVLDLTRVVAHTSPRRFAPLVAYALGLAADAGTDPAQRTATLQTTAAAVEQGRAIDRPADPR